jgi:hypothetical protein
VKLEVGQTWRYPDDAKIDWMAKALRCEIIGIENNVVEYICWYGDNKSCRSHYNNHGSIENFTSLFTKLVE